MQQLELAGCSTRPLGSYLKALGVLRLVSEQADPDARGWWSGDCFQLSSKLTRPDLIRFFVEEYRPTPVLGPWNGGSGFYEKDRKIGIDALAGTTSDRFAGYRTSISFLRDLPEVRRGKAEKNEEEERRTAILRASRNNLPDSAVEWLDASMGLTSEGKRSFPPILGTGGNEGRLDYTNNFMERLATLLIAPDKKTPVSELLEGSLFASETGGLHPAAVGQFDPGRTGGFNQGQGIDTPDIPVNPWDFVLTVEGAVAWASGLYRRQGVRFGTRSLLCSPFTVSASNVGYGSASGKDDARAEIWTPVWSRPACYSELKTLLREGRASLDDRPAETGIQFAEAACSLGVDRGIDKFVRYNLLKRRGDSYIAMPAGVFPTGYRSQSDQIRELRPLLARIDSSKIPAGAESLRRAIDAAIYEALLHEDGKAARLRELMASLGRFLRWVGRTGASIYFRAELSANDWIRGCGATREVRIAAALASIYDRETGAIRDNLFMSASKFAWTGRSLPERMASVLEKRMRVAEAEQSQQNPFGAGYALHPGDATLFIEGSIEDNLVEDLLFAFTCLNWKDYRPVPSEESAEVLPVYAVLKCLFLPHSVLANGEKVQIRTDSRILPLLSAGRIEDAANIAVHRLRIAGLNPLRIHYQGGMDARRLAASLLIPVRYGRKFTGPILQWHEMKET